MQIVYKKADEWKNRVKTSDNEWYEWQRMTTNGTTRDNEWQRMATSDNKWQRVTTNDELHRVTTNVSDNE